MIYSETDLIVDNPQLPAAYQLIKLDQVNCLRETACELAEQDYDEGTIVWVKQQTNSRARLNKQWISDYGDLHCAILLRPDFEQNKYQQLLIVAIVSLGNAVARHVSAMTALGYSWPNDIVIARDKIASVWLDQGVSAAGDWLSISLSANIANAPDSKDINAISIHQAEGNKSLTDQILLESYSREFIKQINNWAERGFEYIFKKWQVRLQNNNDQIELETRTKTHSGRVKGVTKDADLQLETVAGQIINISLYDYMELGHA